MAQAIYSLLQATLPAGRRRRNSAGDAAKFAGDLEILQTNSAVAWARYSARHATSPRCSGRCANYIDHI